MTDDNLKPDEPDLVSRHEAVQYVAAMCRQLADIAARHSAGELADMLEEAADAAMLCLAHPDPLPS